MNSVMQANIKKQLSEKNMSAAELERRTGIPHAVINILHGRSKNPSIHTAQAIAKELGCSVEDLLSEQPASKTTTSNLDARWEANLYKMAFTAVYDCIQSLKLQPKAKLVSECITEVYLYALGSANKEIDLRFVQWIIHKSFQANDVSK